MALDARSFGAFQGLVRCGTDVMWAPLGPGVVITIRGWKAGVANTSNTGVASYGTVHSKLSGIQVTVTPSNSHSK